MPHRTERATPLGARTPRGHQTKSQAPREGNPADTHLTHQGERPSPNARNKEETSHTTPKRAPQPAARHASRTTKRANLSTGDPSHA